MNIDDIINRRLYKDIYDHIKKFENYTKIIINY